MIRKLATIDDLYEVEGKAELVNGEIVHIPPTRDIPARWGGTIYLSLREHERKIGGGIAYPDNAAFLANLPHRGSFSPVAAWYTGSRSGMKFLPKPPDFAAEVRSEND
jgi:Uma2 family endonuclease